ncbi:MAG: hypothetical protein AAGG48_07850 [Planctomycetota bacterium]
MSNNKDKTTIQPKNQPKMTVRFGNVKATVWENDSDGDSFITTKISRTYRREDGSYGDSNSFSHQELLAVKEIAHIVALRLTDADNSEL